MVKIESTRFGEIVVDGRTHGDVLIINDNVIPRELGLVRKVFGTSHRIGGEELKKLVEDRPEVIIIGTGQYGALKIDEDIREKIEKKGIELLAMETPSVVKTFNTLSRQKKVNALIHTTC